MTATLVGDSLLKPNRTTPTKARVEESTSEMLALVRQTNTRIDLL